MVESRDWLWQFFFYIFVQNFREAFFRCLMSSPINNIVVHPMLRRSQTKGHLTDSALYRTSDSLDLISSVHTIIPALDPVQSTPTMATINQAMDRLSLTNLDTLNGETIPVMDFLEDFNRQVCLMSLEADQDKLETLVSLLAGADKSWYRSQCTRKTFMIHQTFVRWALYILFKFVKFLIRHLGLAIGNDQCVRWFSWTLRSLHPDIIKSYTKNFGCNIRGHRTSHGAPTDSFI